MAGKRQHYLPRFLSKGFNSKNKSKEPRSWVFTNDKVYETNLKNIGLQQYFCSGDLDLKVTDLEREFSKQIDNIRKLNSTTNIRNVEIISKLFYFQLIRTRNIRLTLRNIYNYSLTSASEKIKKDFSQGNVIQKFRDYEQYKKLCKLIPQERLEDMINQRIKIIERTGMIDLHFEKLFQQTEVVLENTHNSIIEKATSVEEDERTKAMYENLLDLYWNVIVFNDNSLVLGDCGCYIKNSEGIATTWINTKNIEKVLFPVSSKHLIIGSNKHLQGIDLEETNIGSCQCSKEFFISSVKTEREISYIKYINQDTISN